MKAQFETIAREGEGLYKEKGSKFIALAYRVESVEEVEERLAHLRKTYHDARHHCYAYVVGEEQEQFRANDDGEPGHSAGDPILGQIRSKNLTNCLVVVVRYFGGTKLGVSGLIHAYKTAAREALDDSGSCQVEITQLVEITYSYEATNAVMRLIDQFDIDIKEQNFASSCLTRGLLNVGKIKEFEEETQKIKNAGEDVRYVLNEK